MHLRWCSRFKCLWWQLESERVWEQMHFWQGHSGREIQKGSEGCRQQFIPRRNHLCSMSVVWNCRSEGIYFLTDG